MVLYHARVKYEEALSVYFVFFVGLWGALEMGKLTEQEFQAKISIPQLAPDSIKTLFAYFRDGAFVDPCPEFIDAIKCLKSEGILVGLLTNNWFMDEKNTFLPIDQSLFDVVSNTIF